MAVVEQVTNSIGQSYTEPYGQSWADGREPEGLQSDNDQRTMFTARSRRVALLSRVVEKEILPRLAVSRASAGADTAAAHMTTESDTIELVRLLLGDEDDGAGTFIHLLELRGATPSSLYLGIVTDAARRLGQLWEDDRCDFARVTISLGRLQQVVRALSPRFQAAAVTPSTHPDTILLLPAPAEQHTLGLVILSEFFLREGWHVIGGPVSAGPVSGGCDAAATVGRTWVDVAGFSLGSASRVEGLTACISSVRKASKNRYLFVMVGGPLFLEHPELVARVGADTTARDATAAVRQARGLLTMRAAAE